MLVLALSAVVLKLKSDIIVPGKSIAKASISIILTHFDFLDFEGNPKERFG
jgi:hypothetical protein